ncbi:MAG: hypothetical protein WKF58_16290 [Ilumatobacteraceae bacterium]
MDAAGEVAQLVDGFAEILHRLRQDRSDSRAGVAVQACLGQPQGQRDRDQALLRAVVQVALDAPALGIAGGDDPRPRRGDLGQLGFDLGLQLLVVDRQSYRGDDGVDRARDPLSRAMS